MSPQHAIEYIRSFSLPEEEERFLIERDVCGKSYTQIAKQYHISTATIERRRRKAFSKIAEGSSK